MKKLIALMLVLAMVLSFAACGKKPDEPKQDEPKPQEQPVAKTYDDYMKMDINDLKKEIKTIAAGKLTVATSPDFAPYEFYVVDEKGNAQLAGFDMDLAKYIAEYLGLTADIIPMDFDGTLAELAAKKVDVSLAGYSPDPDRMDKMDFSDIYYMGGQSFCVSKANENKFAALADANNKAVKVAAQTASIQEKLANENTPDADIVSLQKVTDIIAELITGKIDGAFIETAVAETYAKNYPDLVVKFPVPYDAEGSAVGVSKDNAALLAGINKAIAEALKSGKMDEFVATANDLSSGDNVYEGLLENK